MKLAWPESQYFVFWKCGNMASGSCSAAGSEGSAASGCGLEIFAEEGASGCCARAVNGKVAEMDNRIRNTRAVRRRPQDRARGLNAGADKMDRGAPVILKMNFNFIITRYARQSGRLGA